MKKLISKYLSATGLKFPESESELSAFEKTHEGYDYSLNEAHLDPYKILSSIKQYEKKKKTKVEITNIDYHKRVTLAAEIVYQLKEDLTVGHLKLQKLMYLCQHTTQMSLHTNFLRQAMGPYDPQLMRSIDSQFKKRNWFEFKTAKYSRYVPLSKCGEHRGWYEKYFADQLLEIETLVEIFRGMRTNKVELVATIFGCWHKAIAEQVLITDSLLIQGVYDWHETKKEKFTDDQIVKAIAWMKEKGVYPKEQ
ncbi:MAG: hypothetical protein HYZ14_05300 [Bacteroidetes bacterium]|nr:hypothetical protein [Bacteroidota bacterium]